MTAIPTQQLQGKWHSSIAQKTERKIMHIGTISDVPYLLEQKRTFCNSSQFSLTYTRYM